MRSLAVAAAVAMFSMTPAAFAHGGEDHGAPPPTVSQGVTPRAVAATEEFEVVAALEGKQLVVYVDRFATNEPVVKAKVEIEGAGLKGLAAEAAPGTYVMDIATAMPPAKHALTISIETGDSADLLSATLDTSLAVVAEEHAHNWGERVVWSLATLLLLVTTLLIVRRNKKKAKGIHK
ncbi:MAG: hypothetical protein OEL20_16370 [Sulfuritalea sp.]|nr:hypothetical protein [Sulfuritalea sp.]